MKFKLFGGLDCPDTLLAQLSVVGNTDIVSTKALTALTDHVMTVLLMKVAATPSALGDNADSSTLTDKNNSDGDDRDVVTGGLTAAEIEVRALTLKLFADVLKPITVAASSSSGSSSSADRFDGLATKAVQFHEAQRLQRAKAAAAAAKKFVVGTTAAEIEQMSLQPATTQQQLWIAEDALSQALVALSHIITNMARFAISDDALSTELTMLGMAPECVDVIRSTVKSALSGFRDRSAEEEAEAAANSGKGASSSSSTFSSSAYGNKLAFIFGGGGVSADDEEATTATILRNISLLSCPRMGSASPIGAITPYTRTSAITALQQAVAPEEAEDGTVAPLSDEAKALADSILTNTNEDAAQIAVAAPFIKISVLGCDKKNGGAIELTHAQARTLLNELVLARDIMRASADAAEDE